MRQVFLLFAIIVVLQPGIIFGGSIGVSVPMSDNFKLHLIADIIDTRLLVQNTRLLDTTTWETNQIPYKLTYQIFL
jgi:hypothetical protein